MSLTAIRAGLKPLQLAFNALRISVTGTPSQERFDSRCGFVHPRPKLPRWRLQQERAKYAEDLTPENEEFLQEVIYDTYGPPKKVGDIQTYANTPLIKAPLLRGEWFPKCRRAGLIGIKLGHINQWLTDGKPVAATLIQILDNHVIRYEPPKFNHSKKYDFTRKRINAENYGHLIVGSVNCDPQKFTKAYNGLFTEAGVMPKKLLTKFYIHPNAAIQPGTPLYAAHFKVGDVLDVSGVTIYRGFQGVMDRWGFRGQPATHGATKTHRRPGNIGGAKAKVWPGTKMPGCVGNKLRTVRGIKILRINHKYNVIYLLGRSIPGNVNSFVYLHDTILPLRRLKTPPNFPTYYPEDHVNDPLPNEEFDSSLFDFSSPSIIFKEETTKQKK